MDGAAAPVRAALVRRAGEGAVVVASAVTDAGAGRADVPDRSLLSETLDGVQVDPL